jgi:hypothetical protein
MNSIFNGKSLLTGAALVALSAMPALAQGIDEAAVTAAIEAQTPKPNIVFNTLLFLMGGFLVMWMAAGFACSKPGMVRSKNVSMQCLKNIGLYSIAGLMFWVVGYQVLMYPGDGQWRLVRLHRPISGLGCLTRRSDTANGYSTAPTGSSRWCSAPRPPRSFRAPSPSASSSGRSSSSSRPDRHHLPDRRDRGSGAAAGSATWASPTSPARPSCTRPVAGLRSTGAIIIGARRRQIRRRTVGSPDARLEHPARHARHVHPVARLVRLQWRLAARHGHDRLTPPRSRASSSTPTWQQPVAWSRDDPEPGVYGKVDLTMALNGALAGLVSITAEPLTPTPIWQASSSAVSVV